MRSLLCGMSLLAFANGREKHALNDKAIDQNIKKLQEIDKQQQVYKYLYRAEEEKLKRSISSLNRIGAGVSDRFNWQLLHQYVSYAMPQPNGDRLAATSKRFEPVRDTYWTTDKEAQKAFEVLEQMRYAKNETLSPEEFCRPRPLSQETLDPDQYRGHQRSLFC